jgi:hypothetical protein
MQSARQLLAESERPRRRRREPTPEDEEEPENGQQQNDESGISSATEDKKSAEFIVGENQKGGAVLWFEGFRFVKKYPKKGVMYWMCEESTKKQCPVKAQTLAVGPHTNGKILPSREQEEHNHLPTPLGFKVLFKS